MELEPSVFRGTLRSVEKMEASVVPRTVGKGKRGEPELQKCAPIEEMSGVAETCNDTSFPAAYCSNLLRSAEETKTSIVPHTVGKGKSDGPTLQKRATIEEMSGVAETCDDTSLPAAYPQQSLDIARCPS